MKRLLIFHFIAGLHFITILGSCTHSIKEIRFVPIGDSYTIGAGASRDQSWPAVLTQHLKARGHEIELKANPARSGWTTSDALMYEIPIFNELKPNFSTLMIGVNDWVQNVDAGTFRRNFRRLLAQMLTQLEKDRLLIINIPDFSFTPNGPMLARGRNISRGVAQFNKIIEEEAKSRNLRVVDLYSVSKKMGERPANFAEDGLHPSAEGYAYWESIIFPEVELLLKKE